MSQSELRFGFCSCLPAHYADGFPDELSVGFIGNGRRIVKEFSLQKIIIPQAREDEALVESRIHLFVDGHFSPKSKRWNCFLEFLSIVRYSSTCYEGSFVRNVQVGNHCLRTERWREWGQEELPPLSEILSGARSLLQRYKRRRGLRGLNQWLRRMTPKNWNVPSDLLIHSKKGELE